MISERTQPNKTSETVSSMVKLLKRITSRRKETAMPDQDVPPIKSPAAYDTTGKEVVVPKAPAEYSVTPKETPPTTSADSDGDAE